MLILTFFIFLLLRITNPNGAVLIIIDGAGESSWKDSNGLQLAETPTLDYLKQNFPYASLVAAQQPVGLLRSEPGSSAVGHQTLGLGRTTPSYYQSLELSLRLNSNSSLKENKLLRNSFKNRKNKIHFAGQCTDSGVFAHTKFLKPMFEAAQAENVSEVYVHCFLMSMARPPSTYLKDVELEKPVNGPQVILSTIHSSETSLDKNRNWTKTSISYNAMIDPKYGNYSTRKDAEEFLDYLWKTNPSPEFQPIILNNDAVIQDNDILIFFNFREDKTYQIANAFINGLDNKSVEPLIPLPKNLHVIPMVLYEKSLSHIPTILPAIEYPNSLGSWISQKGFKQLRVSEQYKRPHVTIFFSGGILQPLFKGEDRYVDFQSMPDSLIPFHPTMNASLVSKTVIDAIKSHEYKLIVANFANVDATGHCGNTTAVKMAIEHVDQQISQILEMCEQNNYALFVTADHGNGEENTLLNGNPQVEHTVNNVPFITNILGYHIKPMTYGQSPFIGNVAASILKVLNIEIPPEMEPPILEKNPVELFLNPSFTPAIQCILILEILLLFVIIIVVRKSRCCQLAWSYIKKCDCDNGSKFNRGMAELL